MKRYPVLPDVPRDVSFTHRQLLQGLKEAVSTLQSMSVGQLTRSQLTQHITTIINGNTDMEGAVSAPTAVFNAVVIALPSVVGVEWTPANYTGHAYTEIFVQRTLLNADGLPIDAPLFSENNLFTITSSHGATLAIPLVKDLGIYIWLRHVNAKKQVGPLLELPLTVIPLSAQTILDIVSGEINYIHLDSETQAMFSGDDVIALESAVADLNEITSRHLTYIVEIDTHFLDFEERVDFSDRNSGESIIQEAVNMQERTQNVELHGNDIIEVANDLRHEIGIREAFEKRYAADGVATTAKLERIVTGYTDADKAVTDLYVNLRTNFITSELQTAAEFKSTRTTISTGDAALSLAIDNQIAAFDDEKTLNQTERKYTRKLIADGDKSLAQTIEELTASVTTDKTYMAGEIKRVETLAVENDESFVQEQILMRADFVEEQARSNATKEHLTTLIANVDGGIAIDFEQLKIDFAAEQVKTEATFTEVHQARADGDKAVTDLAVVLRSDFEAEKVKTVAVVDRLDTTIASGDKAVADSQKTLRAEFEAEKTATDAQVSRLDSAISTGDSAVALTVTQLRADFVSEQGSSTATVDRLEKAIASGDSALSISQKALETKFDNEKIATAASVKRLDKAISDGDSALSVSQSALKTAFESEQAKTAANVKRIDKAVSDGDKALATAHSSLEAAFNAEKVATTASVNRLDKAVSDGDKALATAQSKLQTAFDSSETATQTAITRIDNTVSTNHIAISSSLETLEASFNTEKDGESLRTAAAINSYNDVITSANGAIAEGVKNYRVSYGGNTYGIESITSLTVNTQNSFTAMWQQTITSPTGMAGQLGMYTANGKTQFVVKADEMLVLNPTSIGGASSYVPFKVDASSGELQTDAVATKGLRVGNANKVLANINEQQVAFNTDSFVLTDPSLPTDFNFAVTDAPLPNGRQKAVLMKNLVVNNAYIEKLRVDGKRTAVGVASAQFTDIDVLGNSKFRGEVDIVGGTIRIGDNFSVDKDGNAKVKGDLEANSLKANTLMVSTNHIHNDAVSGVHSQFRWGSTSLGHVYGLGKGTKILFIVTSVNQTKGVWRKIYYTMKVDGVIKAADYDFGRYEDRFATRTCAFTMPLSGKLTWEFWFNNKRANDAFYVSYIIMRK